MKKIAKQIGFVVLMFIGLFALASCGAKNLSMAEKFNQAGIALSEDNSFTEINVDDVKDTIENQQDNNVVVIVYSNLSSTNGNNIVHLDQLQKQYNDYGKQKYSTEISFSLYFVDNRDLSDEEKDTFFDNSLATNSGIKDETYAVLVYVKGELDLNTSLSKWDDTAADEINSKIFTFEIGDKLKALVA